MRMTLHHVGCLVDDAAVAVKGYQNTGCFGEASAPVAVQSQKVRVCFLPAGNGTFIEFVEPEPDNAFLIRMLRKGVNYYHVGYECNDMVGAMGGFLAAGAHELTRFHSEAFAGRLCVFLVTAQNQMIELIESA